MGRKTRAGTVVRPAGFLFLEMSRTKHAESNWKTYAQKSCGIVWKYSIGPGFWILAMFDRGFGSVSIVESQSVGGRAGIERFLAIALANYILTMTNLLFFRDGKTSSKVSDIMPEKKSCGFTDRYVIFKTLSEFPPFTHIHFIFVFCILNRNSFLLFINF